MRDWSGKKGRGSSVEAAAWKKPQSVTQRAAPFRRVGIKHIKSSRSRLRLSRDQKSGAQWEDAPARKSSQRSAVNFREPRRIYGSAPWRGGGTEWEERGGGSPAGAILQRGDVAQSAALVLLSSAPPRGSARASHVTNCCAFRRNLAATSRKRFRQRRDCCGSTGLYMDMDNATFMVQRVCVGGVAFGFHRLFIQSLRYFVLFQIYLV